MENLLYTFVLDIKYKLIGLFITIVLNKKNESCNHSHSCV